MKPSSILLVISRLRLAGVATCLLTSPSRAQEVEAQRWINLPNDTNFFPLGYGYTTADISIGADVDTFTFSLTGIW